MAKVTGIGGIFFKSRNPKRLKAWYAKELGFNTDEYGTTFVWNRVDKKGARGYTVWSLFPRSSKYFLPSKKEFMLNFRVDDLAGLLRKLKAHGVRQIGSVQEFSYGMFAHVVDPEGNKVELWEPVDRQFGPSLIATTPAIKKTSRRKRPK